MIPAASPSAALAALALSLLHFLWQGCVIAAGLRFALAVQGRAQSRARYGSACVAMAALLLAPLVTFAWAYGRLTAAAALSEGPALPIGSLGPVPGPRWIEAVVLAWGIGAGLMGVRLAGGLLRVRRLVRGASPLPAAFQQIAAELAARLGVHAKVRVAESPAALVPSVVGWLRPVILLPAAVITGIPRAALEAVIAHELCHVRRYDYLINLLQSVVEALLFYHPAVHWVSRALRVEREHCCDDLVVDLLDDPVLYARALLTVESIRSAPERLSPAATGGSLMDRIQRIVQGPTPSPTGRAGATRAARWLAPSFVAAILTGSIAVAAVACGGGASKADPLPEATAPAELTAEAEALRIAWLPERVRRWTPYFIEAARQHGVDPEVLAIVTLVESLGDPDAVSSSGALGLMQIMPGTAARVALSRGLSRPSSERLRDPAYNIDLGAFYLAKQFEEFGVEGDPGRSLELSAAAYNAGEKQLRAHLEGGAPLPEETAQYKRLVRALWEQRHDPTSPAFSAFQSH
jgi:beta-lactamase regulating signal transducer with metallopeptidase domain